MICHMKHLITLLLNGLAVYVSALVLNMLFPAVLPVYVQSYPVAIGVSIAIALVNMLIKPVLKLVTLPINIITLGFFSLIVNGICMLIVPYIVNIFVPGGFVISGLLWAIVYGALVSFTQSTLAVLVK